ncbi:hypothetical protein FRC14_005605 [Serendipita sp. 396]|nr:hypothetical protein FRC14_005605 [Serendipita sp. 396]KAG8787272.1 hypothetical protein FRC15_009575 [Serendipita sp. 397]KAG8828040.1 hypothetical protein FRC19_009896 [Serendipita sp. 401]KAG8838595.1 hypothetical protein FRC18_003853 [Serendipita sp. 400]KAG8840110.1 hypothetical protein FRB91_006535 [Serendipita sp. 411]KAG8875458.1 hypothetical protein FRC20_003872 [Serendipita sp. 405]KAG9058344.1 hypothetical protein FS842_010070 [Serendipita sp. 407]
MNLMITVHETNRETETIWALCMASGFMPSITMLELSWLFPIPATALVTLEKLPFLQRLSLRGTFQDYSDILKSYCSLPTLQTLIDKTSTAQPLRAPNLKSLLYEPIPKEIQTNGVGRRAANQILADISSQPEPRSLALRASEPDPEWLGETFRTVPCMPLPAGQHHVL